MDASHVTCSRVRIFATDALDVAVAWRVGFDSRDLARRFADAASQLDNLLVTRDAAEVTL